MKRRVSDMSRSVRISRFIYYFVSYFVNQDIERSLERFLVITYENTKSPMCFILIVRFFYRYRLSKALVSSFISRCECTLDPTYFLQRNKEPTLMLHMFVERWIDSLLLSSSSGSFVRSHEACRSSKSNTKHRHQPSLLPSISRCTAGSICEFRGESSEASKVAEATWR